MGAEAEYGMGYVTWPVCTSQNILDLPAHKNFPNKYHAYKAVKLSYKRSLIQFSWDAA